MNNNEVSLVQERFLPKVREVAEALRICGTKAHIFVIPTEPAWPIFFVGPDGKEDICPGVNTRPADDAYGMATQRRRADVARASIQT